MPLLLFRYQLLVSVLNRGNYLSIVDDRGIDAREEIRDDAVEEGADPRWSSWVRSCPSWPAAAPGQRTSNTSAIFFFLVMSIISVYNIYLFLFWKDIYKVHRTYSWNSLHILHFSREVSFIKSKKLLSIIHVCKLSVKRNLSLLQSDIHWNPLHQNDSYLDTN